jgi:hypothetical protein
MYNNIKKIKKAYLSNYKLKNHFLEQINKKSFF